MTNEPPKENGDPYALGMAASGTDAIGITERLDRFHFELFSRFLGARTLEVGAGNGRLTTLAAAVEGVEELVISEPSPHFARILDERFADAPNVRLAQAETGELEERYAEYFDCVFSSHVMEHIEDDRRFLEECLALTKPGGYVVAQVPALQFLFSKLDENIGHYRRYDKSAIRKLVRGLPADVSVLKYNDLVGVAGSFWFSKVRKLEYQSDEGSKNRFLKLHAFYSRYVVPAVAAIESVLPVPIGLNLTLVLEKRGSNGQLDLEPED